MRDDAGIAVSELGEAHITNTLLLDIFTDVIAQSVLSDDIDGPTGMYLLGSLNMLGKLGWIEIRYGGRSGTDALPATKPEVNTSEPPRFLSDAFRKENGGDVPADE